MRTYLYFRPFILMITFFLTWMACIYVHYDIIPIVKMWINGPGMTAEELNTAVNQMSALFPADSLKAGP